VLVAHVREVERPAAMVAGPARASALPPALHVESEEAAREIVEAAVYRLRRAGVQASGEVGPGAANSAARELLVIAQAFNARAGRLAHLRDSNPVHCIDAMTDLQGEVGPPLGRAAWPCTVAAAVWYRSTLDASGASQQRYDTSSLQARIA
jgi:hypothetical protein